MKNLILIVLLFINSLSALDFAEDYLKKKDIKGAVEIAKKNIIEKKEEFRINGTGDGYISDSLFNLGNAFVLQNKFKLVQKIYLEAFSYQTPYHITKDYKKLYKIYPEKKVQLEKGLKILNTVLFNIKDYSLKLYGKKNILYAKDSSAVYMLNHFAVKKAKRFDSVIRKISSVYGAPDSGYIRQIIPICIKYKITPNKLEQYGKIAKPNEIIVAIQNNISIKELQNINKITSNNFIHWIIIAKCKSAKEIKQWINIGLKNYDYDYVKELKAMNIKQAKNARKYAKLKIEQVKFLTKNNITPTKLIVSLGKFDNKISYALNKLYFTTKENLLSKVRLLKNNGCKKLENELFSLADEYDNNGKCYGFSGHLLQRLSRNTGLVNNGENVTFIKFSKSWKSNDESAYFGVIKGLGNYKYQTAYGSMKNIPQGKVIFRQTLQLNQSVWF